MRKQVIIAGILVLLTAGVAVAEWLVDFRNVYQQEGIDPAVIEALKQGATPDAIMENGLALEGINPQNLIKAMYCAGIRGDDIRAAGQMYDVTDLLIVAGYKKSVEECGDAVVDTQAYTPPQGRAIGFFGLPVPGRGANVSPARFGQF